MTESIISLEGEFAALRLLPLDLRGSLGTALRLSLIIYDPWIVVFTVDELSSYIVVAVPTDGILGARAA